MAVKIFKMIDEVVDEAGKKNVVQVITDNAINYKAAGLMLMKKRKGIICIIGHLVQLIALT